MNPEQENKKERNQEKDPKQKEAQRPEDTSRDYKSSEKKMDKESAFRPEGTEKDEGEEREFPGSADTREQQKSLRRRNQGSTKWA